LINQDEVDKHIDELRIQLSACRSVLDYIQAWNIYGHRFFANNFGKPANCYGRAHIDSMLATFRRIQEKLFPDHPGGVGEHLKLTIASRFNISPADIPDGYLYWSSCHGGQPGAWTKGGPSKNGARLVSGLFVPRPDGGCILFSTIGRANEAMVLKAQESGHLHGSLLTTAGQTRSTVKTGLATTLRIQQQPRRQRPKQGYDDILVKNKV
jgi:hypothetical protein